MPVSRGNMPLRKNKTLPRETIWLRATRWDLGTMAKMELDFCSSSTKQGGVCDESRFHHTFPLSWRLIIRRLWPQLACFVF
jgi:hypothetical protein